MSSSNRSRTTVIFPESYWLWCAANHAGCRFETSGDAIQWAQELMQRGIDPVNIYIDHDYINLPYLVMWRVA